MQVDVKILSKTLAYRLHRYLCQLINPEQKGFVRGRSLHHHVRFLHDLQELLKRRNQDGYALFLDFAKAYDRVNWNYLFRVLERVGCGPAFRNWVKLLYSNTEATLAVNGVSQEVLRPSRGVKQGDPLSSLLFVLSIEPLGNLLRALPEVGIRIGPNCVGTGLYFADDSTLLSSSVTGLLRQVELVQLYCSGSGALLNLNKSQLVAFNGDTISADSTPLGVGTSPSVVYLGVPVGPAVNSTEVCSSLEANVCKRLARWGCRARTLRGRLLILNAMVFSVLWHFTPHFSIPGSVVRRLQFLAEKYLLTRKWDPGGRFFKLARASICQVSFRQGGLQIPSLSDTIQTQRVIVLQQLFWLDPGELWKATSTELLRCVLPFGLHLSPFDFLACPFSRRSTVIPFQTIPSWWAESWFVASKLPQLSGQFQDGVEHQTRFLNANVWHNSCLQIQINPDKWCSLMVRAGPMRDFRTAFAEASGCRCLMDFFSRGEWPMVTQFLARFVLTLPTFNLRTRIRQLVRLYDDLTSLVEQVVRPDGLLQGPVTLDAFAPPFGVFQNGVLSAFPSLTKRNIRRIFKDDTLEMRDHPLVYQFAGFTRENLVDTLLALKDLRQVVLPVYADLQFRLCWKLLPTRSRFWFLQHTSETGLQCGYPDCTSVETEKHLFFDCARVAVLWGIVADDWRLFLPAITWEIACVPLEPTWPRSQLSYAPELKILWTIFRSVTLHCVWTTRNKHHFENRPPLEARNAIYQVYSTFSSHFRAILRSSCLHHFPPGSRFHRFATAHPRLFSLRRQVLCADETGCLQAPPCPRTTA